MRPLNDPKGRESGRTFRSNSGRIVGPGSTRLRRTELHSPRSLYYLYFCYVRSYFKGQTFNWGYDTRAFILVCVMELCWLIPLAVYLFVWLDVPQPGRLPVFISAIVLAAVNHVFLFGKERRRYDAIVAKWPKRQRVRGGILVVAFTFVTLLIFLLQAYHLGWLREGS
jgi:hypothetical protein